MARGCHAIAQPPFDAVGRFGEHVAHVWLLRFAPAAQHVADLRVASVRRCADTDTQPGICGAYTGLDITQAVVTSGTAFGSQPQGAEGKMEVVDHHQQVGGQGLVEGEQGLHGLAGSIDVRLRFDQQDLTLVRSPRGDLGVVLAAPLRDAVPLGQGVDDIEADVVAGASVLAADVADAEDEPHVADGGGIAAGARDGSMQAMQRLLDALVATVERMPMSELARVIERDPRSARRWVQVLIGQKRLADLSVVAVLHLARHETREYGTTRIADAFRLDAAKPATGEVSAKDLQAFVSHQARGDIRESQLVLEIQSVLEDGVIDASEAESLRKMVGLALKEANAEVEVLETLKAKLA